MFRGLAKHIDRLAVFLIVLSALLVKLVKRLNWHKVGAVFLTLLPLLFMGGAAALAAGPTVGYTTPTGNIATKVTSAVEGVATTLQYILGGTALLAFVIAAIMNHVPNQRTKEQAKEVAMAAVVGILLAVFAPSIINFLMGLQV